MSDSSPRPRQPRNASPEETKVRVPFQKTRWRYQKDGRDFGPWTGKQMLDKLQSRDVDADTRAYEEWNEKWFRVGDVPEFASLLDTLRKEDANRALEQETARTEAEVRSTRSRRWWITLATALTLVATAIAYLMLASQSDNQPRSVILAGLYVALDIPDLNSDELLKTLQDEKQAPVAIAKKKARTKKRTARGSTRPPKLISTDSQGTLVLGSDENEQSLDFTKSVTPQEQERFESDVSQGLTKLKAPLRRCMEREAANRKDFQKAKLKIQISSSGRIGSARILESKGVTSGFLACIRRATSSFGVPPYGGSSYDVKLELSVE